MYTIDDAERAYYLATSKDGGQPLQLSGHGWEEVGTNANIQVFAYRDANGFKACQVTFIDKDGTALVHFRSAALETVNLFDFTEDEASK